MNELAKQDMIQLDFPKKKLIVTGNPFFDTFSYQSLSKKELISKQSSGNKILCISAPKPVVDKEGNLECVFDPSVADEILEIVPETIPVIIRLHPKDSFPLFADHFSGRANVTLEQGGDVNSSLEQATLIVGNYSTVLFQAALQGKPVISYRKDVEEKKDDFIGKRLSLCYSVYCREEFQLLVLRAMEGKLLPKKFNNKIIPKSSTEIVLAKISELVAAQNRIETSPKIRKGV